MPSWLRKPILIENNAVHVATDSELETAAEKLASKIDVDRKQVCIILRLFGDLSFHQPKVCDHKSSERVLLRHGTQTRLHAYSTNIEGEWDEVMPAVKRCHEAVHAMGAPRISTTIKLGTRTDRVQTMDEKVRSVEEKVAG